jgi:hypothetical protein
MANKLTFKRIRNNFDKVEIIATEPRITVEIDEEKQQVYFKDTYVPFDKVLQVAELIKGGLNNVKDE